MNPDCLIKEKASDPETETSTAADVGQHFPVKTQRLAHAALYLGDLHFKVDLLGARNVDAVFDWNLVREGACGQPQGQVGLGY